jgi:hypothetical protein
MVNLSTAQKHQLATYRDRLSRVERGEVWGSDYPGPYTAEEKGGRRGIVAARSSTPIPAGRSAGIAALNESSEPLGTPLVSPMWAATGWVALET